MIYMHLASVVIINMTGQQVCHGGQVKSEGSSAHFPDHKTKAKISAQGREQVS